MRLEEELEDCIVRYFSQYSKLKDYMQYVIYTRLSFKNPDPDGLLCSDLIMEQLRDHEKIALDAVKDAVSLENYPLTTQNIDYFESMREKWIQNYRDVKKRSVEYLVSSGQESVACSENGDDYPCPPIGVPYSCPPPIDVPYPETRRHTLYQEAFRALSNIGYTGITHESLKRLNPPDDEYEEEILVMADVRAYFDVAYKVTKCPS